MLVSLVSNAAEPKAAVVEPEAVAPPETLQKGMPRKASPRKPELSKRQIAQQPPKVGSIVRNQTVAVPPTPIITNNTSATNTIPVPTERPSTASPSKPEAGSIKETPGTTRPANAPTHVVGTPGGSGGQGGTADLPAPVPAKPSVDVAALMRSYGAGAIAKVQRSKFFPDSARDAEQSGTTVSVRVKFTVSREGSLLAVSARSDNAELANAAEQAVRRAAPFGSFPAGVDKGSQNFSTTLEYRLH
jgi:protein TonB